MKELCAAYLLLHFEIIIFWQKDIVKKSAHKMLMKLTLGVCHTLTTFFLMREHKAGFKGSFDDFKLLYHIITKIFNIIPEYVQGT